MDERYITPLTEFPSGARATWKAHFIRITGGYHKDLPFYVSGDNFPEPGRGRGRGGGGSHIPDGVA